MLVVGDRGRFYTSELDWIDGNAGGEPAVGDRSPSTERGIGFSRTPIWKERSRS